MVGQQTEIPDPIRAIPLKHWGRWIGAIITLTALLALFTAIFTSPNIDYPVIGEYLFAERLMVGLQYTIFYSVAAEVLGVCLGLIAAVMRQSPNPVLQAVSSGYIWLFRGVPILVQILMWYNVALIFPRLSIGIPFTDIGVSGSTNAIVTTTLAAVLALGLNEGAYMAEIIRAGLISVDHGQLEAARSIGLKSFQSLRFVVLPQAMRMIVPPTGNNFISMLKTTSLVSVIAGSELLTQAQRIYAQNFKTMELLVAASIWYLILTTVASVGQYYIERHYAKGSARQQPVPLWRKVVSSWIPRR